MQDIKINTKIHIRQNVLEPAVYTTRARSLGKYAYTLKDKCVKLYCKIFTGSQQLKADGLQRSVSGERDIGSTKGVIHILNKAQ